MLDRIYDHSVQLAGLIKAPLGVNRLDAGRMPITVEEFVSIGEFLITLWFGRAYAPASAPLSWVTVGVVMMALYRILARDFTSRICSGCPSVI